MRAARGAAASLVALFVAHGLAAAAEKPYDLATFPRGSDPIVDRCHALAEALADKAAATCGHRRGDPNHPWLCPAGEPQRIAALDRCRSLAPTAKDQPAMLYLLGLAYLDLASILDGDRCPRHFYYTEGSSVCVYTGVHFKVRRQPVRRGVESAKACGRH